MSDPVIVRCPDLGATGPLRVSAWLAGEGETVRKGDRLVELLLPGLTYDVAAPLEGRLVEIRATTDSYVGPGDLLGCIRAGEV